MPERKKFVMRGVCRFADAYDVLPKGDADYLKRLLIADGTEKAARIREELFGDYVSSGGRHAVRKESAMGKLKNPEEDPESPEEEGLPEWDDGDICYECTGYGDDYFFDENGELVCACDREELFGD